MSNGLVELYCSSNGDTWFLERDSAGRSFVVHEPNRPSGGHRSRVPAEEFLKRSQGPERQALLRALDDTKEADLDDDSLQAVMRDCPL
jgi:hypothetical protein